MDYIFIMTDTERSSKALNMLLSVLKDGKALAGVAKMPGEGRGGENIGSVRALEENVVNVGRRVVRVR